MKSLYLILALFSLSFCMPNIMVNKKVLDNIKKDTKSFKSPVNEYIVIKSNLLAAKEFLLNSFKPVNLTIFSYSEEKDIVTIASQNNSMALMLSLQQNKFNKDQLKVLAQGFVEKFLSAYYVNVEFDRIDLTLKNSIYPMVIKRLIFLL